MRQNQARNVGQRIGAQQFNAGFFFFILFALRCRRCRPRVIHAQAFGQCPRVIRFSGPRFGAIDFLERNDGSALRFEPAGDLIEFRSRPPANVVADDGNLFELIASLRQFRGLALLQELSVVRRY